MNEQFRNPADAMSHAKLLDRLAEVAVRVGLGLKPGQELVVTAPLDAAALVRRITEHAYKAGASLVTTIFSDEARTRRCSLRRIRKKFPVPTGPAPRLICRRST